MLILKLFTCVIMSQQPESALDGSAIDISTMSTEQKRKLSDNADPTGVSPDPKRQIQIRVEMPNDDATNVEWYRSLFLKLEEMDKKYDDIKAVIDFNNRELGDAKKTMGELKTDIRRLEHQVATLQTEKEQLKTQFQMIKESMIKTSVQMRELNAVFEGVTETYGEDKSLLYNKFTGVLNHMRVFNGQGARVPIAKIDRVGVYVRGQIRPIVVQFMRQSDIELLMKNRLQLPDKIYVHEDFPPEIEERRRILRPIFNKAKKMHEYRGKCRLSFDKLILKGQTFTVAPLNNLSKLPLDLQPRASAEKENDSTIVFFTQGSPLSNFHPAPFVKDNIPYTCSEQYIQAKKAELFEDDETHGKIMLTSNPYQIKALGSRVKNFIEQKWQSNARQIAFDACHEKFTQNSLLLDVLKETGNKTIGEASTDPFWGVGKSLSHVDVLNEDLWTGDNLLGNVLMALREQLTQF